MNTLNRNNASLSKNSTLGTKTTAVGIYGIYLALVIIYFWFGGMKFTHYEAEGLIPMVSNSPLLGWVYHIFNTDLFATILGLLEVSIGLLITGRLISAKLSLIGGILSTGLFITTVSLMFSTPGVVESSLGFPGITVAPGQFLLKDIGLLAASIFVAGHSLIKIEES